MKMLLTILGPDGTGPNDTDLAEGYIDVPIVPVGMTFRFDDSRVDDVYFVKVEAYDVDIHMRPIKGISTAIHIHVFGRIDEERSHYKDIKTLQAAAFDEESQVNYSKKPRGSLCKGWE